MGYIPNTAQDRQALLSSIGISSVDALFKDVPNQFRLKKDLALPAPVSELELLKELKELSQKNCTGTSFLGAGSYRHFIPSAVKPILGRSEFYTAYTPYQAEASQGTLQAIFEYQTLVCELTGLDAANASMYDGATALAEAALLACRQTGRKEIAILDSVNPEYRRVLQTYAAAANFKVNVGQGFIPCRLNETAGLIVQQPNFFGGLEEVEKLEKEIHSKGGLFIVSADPISLGILKAPGSYGADIVVGEGQALGLPMSFGGPGLGLFAVKKELLRQMPGRLAGETVDKDGQRGYCLTLQTREQHIRREKAGSNICSNEALCALAACVYLSLLGKQGLKKVAELCLQKAHYLADKLNVRGTFFKEFVIQTKRPVEDINQLLLKEGIIGGLDLSKYYSEMKDQMLVCVTEMITKEEMDKFAEVIA